MFTITIVDDEYKTKDKERRFYLKLPKEMYVSLLAFTSELEEESLGRDRRMEAQHELYKQKHSEDA